MTNGGVYNAAYPKLGGMPNTYRVNTIRSGSNRLHVFVRGDTRLLMSKVVKAIAIGENVKDVQACDA
eukprot:5806579-Amphidinium_carterae.1